MSKIGVVGCGAIGGLVINQLASGRVDGFELIGILDLVSNEIIENCKQRDPHLQSAKALLDCGPDLVIEAAGHEALRTYGLELVLAGVDLMPMSVGVFADGRFLQSIRRHAEEAGSRLLLPSGAIGALDVLRASCCRGGLDRVVLSSTKKPIALASQPYLIENKIEVDGLEDALTVFEGTAREACLSFPESTNIAASVSLAGIGFDNTQVKVVADPGIPRTTHTLEAKGAFGDLKATLRNRPHPDNPSTTYLAGLSVISALNNIQDVVSFG